MYYIFLYFILILLLTLLALTFNDKNAYSRRLMNEILSASPSSKFLVAMPQLRDSNFFGAVVFIINHTENGAMGFVINRKTDFVIGDLQIPSIKIAAPMLSSPVWYGGPCEPERVWLLHKEKGALLEGEVVLAEGIHISSALTRIEEKPRGPDLGIEDFKLVSGYAGWVTLQLEKELQASSWLTVPVNPKLVFDTPTEHIWEKAVRSLGIDPAQLASDTSFNLH